MIRVNAIGMIGNGVRKSSLHTNIVFWKSLTKPTMISCGGHGTKLIKVARYTQKAKRSPYEILGVSRSASAKEIKLAYFKEAKKYHPDVNPNDPTAKAKFQEISEAYEILSDEKRRRMYDATGYSGSSSSAHSSSTQHAEEIFNSVQQDLDVIREALQSYGEEMKDEMVYAMECVKRSDWEGLLEVAKAHKVLIFGVVVPTFVFLRYPPLVFTAMRILYMGAQAVIAGLVYTGNLHYAANRLWRAIVDLSVEQKKRAENRRGRQ
jgi:hypothetical protein